MAMCRATVNNLIPRSSIYSITPFKRQVYNAYGLCLYDVAGSTSPIPKRLCYHPYLAPHFLPVAASLTLSVPAAIAFTVSKISEKLSKVVNGTFSLSQYVTRSKSADFSETRRAYQDLKGGAYLVQFSQTTGLSPWQRTSLTHRRQRTAKLVSPQRGDLRTVGSQATYHVQSCWKKCVSASPV